MDKLERKVRAGEKLTDEEIMEFIILPLTYCKEQQKNAVKKAVEMAKKIKNEQIEVFIMSGLLVFSDKIISDDLSRQVKEWLMMTKVERLIVQEADAKRLVSVIESIMSKGYDEKDACSLAGVSPIDYENAKRMLESEKVFA